MSRCFPFPPPGYQKKASFEDTDLLTKEKHKEKKHKKDKKDKEKKEGKEKKHKDKDRSKEKHRDKKDRKEKHKDKKDKERDKEKNGASDPKRMEGQTECHNGEKLGPRTLQTNEIKGSKYVQDLERRIRDEDRATGSQFGPKITVVEPRKAELAPGRVVERGTTPNTLEKEKAKDKIEDDKRVNGQRNHTGARGLQNAIFQGADQKVFQGPVKPLEKNDIPKKTEEKEKKKRKEDGRDSKTDKHKDRDRDREKKSKSKDKERNKEKKKEEKPKEIGKTSRDLDKLKASSPKFTDSAKELKINSSSGIKPSYLLKTGIKNSAEEGSLGKRKELEMNGILLDNGLRPNKLPRPVSSSHPAMENGRKLETCLTATVDCNHKVDLKQQKINGLMEVPQQNTKSSRLSPAVGQVSENGEAAAAPVRKPHPDLVYLDRILSVPKVKWSDHDDQEWLFSSRSKEEPKVGSSGAEDEIGKVWAEAVPIETADVIALPYVIPY